MPMTIVDEKGERHAKCHGVLAQQWLSTVSEVGLMLANPIRRAELGLGAVATMGLYCHDPDCFRLNRLSNDKARVAAYYVIMRDITPVAPAPDTSESEKRICKGHPWKKGSYLCQRCARVAIAKRIINERQP